MLQASDENACRRRVRDQPRRNTMTKIMNNDDELKKSGEEAIKRVAVEPTEDDTEGHMMLIDQGASQRLAKSRSAEIERELRDRQRQKEARPNRR
jgi:hypothetical protein